MKKNAWFFLLKNDEKLKNLKDVMKDDTQRNIDYEFWLSEIAGRIKETNKKCNSIFMTYLICSIINLMLVITVIIVMILI